MDFLRLRQSYQRGPKALQLQAAHDQTKSGLPRQ